MKPTVFFAVCLALLVASTVSATRTRDCPEACSRRCQPVCGTDGRTYNNPCLLERTRCSHKVYVEIAHNGTCKGTTPSCRWR
ncbi:PI-actitoxin-Avd5a-like [Penaeus chinensis]|uniref:PI-actitoxin-Avd5a-like n=1 Tax=Penaeus chinensis TaxID=139456 RepID=UPI001FB5C9B1|nr:PI-actitoxin-Avd5a-like [Penaeus chinensis]